MKQLIVPGLLLLGVFGFSGCTSSEENLETAEEDVETANEALEQATREYQEDMRIYRLETEKQIDANNQKIADLKLKATKEKESMRQESMKAIEELERKNNAMKIKLGDYRDEGREKWQSFKKEFAKDMNELGEALKGFGQSKD